jgi:hypothetical protein
MRPPAEGGLASVLLERTFPRAERERFDRAIVGWYVDELNGLGDRLRYWAGRRGEPAVGHQARAHERLRQILGALRWNAKEVLARVGERIEQAPPETPEDWFAPALLLLTLAEDRGQLARLLARVPARALAEAERLARGER